MFSIYKWLEFRKRLSSISNEIKAYRDFGGAPHDLTWTQLSKLHIEISEDCSRYLDSINMRRKAS